jgi:hypothetical protein
MDAAGCEILLREWTTLTAGRTLPPVGPQPLDVLDLEAKPMVTRLSAAAARYWRAQLTSIPQAMFPLPTKATATRNDWHPGLRIRSEVAMTQLAAISARTGTSNSTIMLAAINALVCQHSGHASCVTTSLSGNRVPRALREFFGTLSQDALLTVPVPETGTFDQLVHAVRAAALTAYRAAWYDSTAIWAAITEVSADRGISYARDLVFNDMSPLPTGTDGEFVTAAARSRLPAIWLPGAQYTFSADDAELTASLQPQPAQNIPGRFVVYVYRLDTELDVILHVDPACLDATELLAFGRSLLRLLRAAADGDLPLKDLPALTTLAPMARDADWVLADSCWVELAAERDLLAEVLGNRPQALVAVPDEQLGNRLVCYLTGPADLADLHQRCLALLPGRITVIAPHEYVVCATAPPDPADLASWAAVPVIARGSGRESAGEPR